MYIINPYFFKIDPIFKTSFGVSWLFNNPSSQTLILIKLKQPHPSKPQEECTKPFQLINGRDIFIRKIVHLHGIPTLILSDRDYTFLSQFWQELLKQEGTTLKFITAYHPKSDGKTEVLNRTLKTYLRFYTLTNPNNGHIFFHGQNTGTTPDFKLQRTPFEILCGRYPPSLTCFNLGDTLVDSVALDLIARDEALHQLK
jgi:hypothetical protein